MTVGLRVHG